MTTTCTLCGKEMEPVEGVDGKECPECHASYNPPGLYPDLTELEHSTE